MYSQILMDDDDEMAIKEGTQYLLFYLQSNLYALRGEFITEIVELPQITKVPWMLPCVKGVCNIRGTIVGVIDIARCLLQNDFINTNRTSLVIVKIIDEEMSHKIGFIIDEVYEVEVFEASELQGVPHFGLPIHSKYVEAMIPYKGDFIPLLSLKNVADIEFLSQRENPHAT
ncbi:chemotaxis protein CheW [bacterium]|nr:chemotaxis protein CheW [bacterium]MBU1994187.1 chemotaxis protein CheW [bacterium]